MSSFSLEKIDTLKAISGEHISLSVLDLMQKASQDSEICRAIGMPSNLPYTDAHDWLLRHSGLLWSIGSSEHNTPVGLYLARKVEESITAEYSGYWEISPFILAEYRGVGIIYQTIPHIHQHFRSMGVPGLHAFTWEKQHSSTRLWRKLGYSLLGRTWCDGGGDPGWKFIWAYSLNRKPK